MSDKYYVYILKSEISGKHYIGFSRDPTRRLQGHNAGRSRWSRRHMPWKIIHIEKFEDKTLALRREKQIKKYKNKNYIQQIIKENRIARGHI